MGVGKLEAVRITDQAAEALNRYVNDTGRSWIGLPLSAAELMPRFDPGLIDRFLRIEEQESSYRDQWGNWEFGFSRSFHEGSLWIPQIDDWAASVRVQLAERVDLEPLWPNDHSFAVCLTHDVDSVSPQMTPRQILRRERGQLLAKQPLRKKLAGPVRAVRDVLKNGSFSPSVESGLGRCIEVEREFGVHASYFLPVYPPGRWSPYDCVFTASDPCRFGGCRTTVREMFRELAAEGFDVGLHGSYHSATDATLLADERGRLEKALGLPITTSRQHWLRWNVRVTPGVQEQAGLTADCTFGFNRNVGFRAGVSLPYFPFDFDQQRPVKVLQAPLVLQDAALLRSDGLELNTHLAREVVQRVVDRVAGSGGLVTVLFHPEHVADDGVFALLRSIIEDSLAAGAWVTSLREIEAWWRSREKRLAER
ncbi:MAG: hypothetical protein GY906_00490 [bacterium]|nr:hypothetical protein [bacterium]